MCGSGNWGINDQSKIGPVDYVVFETSRLAVAEDLCELVNAAGLYDSIVTHDGDTHTVVCPGQNEAGTEIYFAGFRDCYSLLSKHLK